MPKIFKSSSFWIALTVFIIAFLSVKGLFSSGRDVSFASKETKACIECHRKDDIHTSQIVEWKKSKHAKAGVGCYECHQADKNDADAFDHEGKFIATIVSPKDCSQCHQKEFKEFDASHHAKAGEILGSLDNYLGEVVEGPGASVQGCQSCHGSLVKVKENGKLDSTTWPNMGIGRLNPDGSKGSCSSCHAKHSFSLKVARSPETCGKCHMGPDHPQKEVFEESKHGIIYAAHKDEMNLDYHQWTLGKEYTQAPNCITCHMGGSKQVKQTHDVGARLSWNLRAKVSKKMKNWESKREDMKKVCQNCHGTEWFNNFYEQLDNTVNLYNKSFAQPAGEIMKRLRKRGKLTKQPFDEEIEWIYFELWHHEGRRLRHGAAMMGPDYVQWHGFYELAHNFYKKFLPKAEKLGEKEYIQRMLKRPEHNWIKGYKSKRLAGQESAFKAWSKMRKKMSEQSSSK
jgi:hydroxylamine dehydrogenase